MLETLLGYVVARIVAADATVSGSRVRTLRCEYCSTDYSFEISTDANAAAFRSPIGRSVHERSREAAEKELEKKIARMIVPCPCPACGRLQRDMLRSLRWRTARWFFLAGGFGVAYHTLLACGLMQAADENRHSWRTLLSWPWLATATVSALLVLAALWLQFHYVPRPRGSAAASLES
ncbi:MAG: hypothetical protein AMXMBFR47_19910 [Planctomycetota bacterium]